MTTEPVEVDEETFDEYLTWELAHSRYRTTETVWLAAGVVCAAGYCIAESTSAQASVAILAVLCVANMIHSGRSARRAIGLPVKGADWLVFAGALAVAAALAALIYAFPRPGTPASPQSSIECPSGTAIITYDVASTDYRCFDAGGRQIGGQR